MRAIKRGYLPFTCGLLLGCLFSTSAFSQLALNPVVLNIVPKQTSTNNHVTLLIETVQPDSDVVVSLLALRIDSNNDGMIETEFASPKPVGREIQLKDLDKIVPYAKDQDPQRQRIQFRFATPEIPGEYLVEVKSKGGDKQAGAQQPLLVYTQHIATNDNVASMLNRWPATLPKVVFSELYRSLRVQPASQINQQFLWQVDMDNAKQQLTRKGLATDPQWAPAGKKASWVAYSYIQPERRSFDIWILDAEHPENRQQITASAEDDLSPIWSPNGKMLAFLRSDALYIAQIDKAQSEQLIISQAGIKELIAWDKQTQSIIYSAVDKSSQLKQIWAVNINSRKKTALTYHPNWGLMKSVSTSNNHTRLLFEWNARTSHDVNVYLYDFQGPTSVNLTEGFQNMKCIKPSLSADGNHVVFVAVPVD